MPFPDGSISGGEGSSIEFRLCMLPKAVEFPAFAKVAVPVEEARIRRWCLWWFGGSDE